MKVTRADVEAMLHDYYEMPGHTLGGAVHIVIENHNADDDDVEWCYEYARKEGDGAGMAIALALRQLSRTQRLKVAKVSYCPRLVYDKTNKFVGYQRRDGSMFDCPG